MDDATQPGRLRYEVDDEELGIHAPITLID
jgi:hypothetical protein